MTTQNSGQVTTPHLITPPSSAQTNTRGLTSSSCSLLAQQAPRSIVLLLLLLLLTDAFSSHRSDHCIDAHLLMCICKADAYADADPDQHVDTHRCDILCTAAVYPHRTNEYTKILVFFLAAFVPPRNTVFVEKSLDHALPETRSRPNRLLQDQTKNTVG